MKIKIFAVIALLVAGVLVTMNMINSQTAHEQEYEGYLELARTNAEKNIPFTAVKNYRLALGVDASDESVYQEYLKQAELLSGNDYAKAVEDYIVYFPMSATAYETLCDFYYNNEQYVGMMEYALEAKEKGIATEKIKKYYLECSVMYRVMSGGYDEAGSFVGNYAKVRMEDLYGYVGPNGKYAILPKYKEASIFLNTYAAVNCEDEIYMMNESAYKVAIPDKEVDYMGVLNNGKALVSLDGKYDYVSGDLVVPKEFRYDDATMFKQNVAAVKKDDKWALINSNMEHITDFVFDDVLRDEYNACMNNGVVFVKKDGMYYMCNALGEKISNQAFEDAYPFVGTEPAAVKKDGKWGFVDNAGNMVIEPMYENAKSFNIGLGAVCKDGLWGYVDTSNTVRIEFQFIDCLPFSWNGATAICDDEGKWTYIRLLPYI